MASHGFSAKTKRAEGAERVPLGGLGDEIWSAFTSTVTYDDDLVVELEATYETDRIAVQSVTVRPGSSRSLAATDMTRLQLASAVHDAAEGAVSPGHGHLVDRRAGRAPVPDELRLVAAVYWFHYVSWGNPRRAVMNLWGLPRSTANRWIRKAGELFELPGPHREEQ